MRHCALRTAMFLPMILFCTVLSSAFVFATEIPKEIEIDYERERIARSSVGRPSISQPAAGNLPRALTEGLRDSFQRVEAHGREGNDFDTMDGLETRAAVAATWTARQQITIFGRREIYQAGFYDGLQQAFHDPLVGDWDFRQGHQAGLRPGRAMESRQRRATEDAEPISAVRNPNLLDVFEDLPLTSVIEPSGLEPLPDPLKLYRSDNYEDFYDQRWTESERALEYWIDHHQDRAFWRQLGSAEKARFAEMFRSIYSRQLPDLLVGAGEGFYARGHGDGWSYGAMVAQEWSYRQGFHQGFMSALHEHARQALVRPREAR